VKRVAHFSLSWSFEWSCTRKCCSERCAQNCLSEINYICKPIWHRWNVWLELISQCIVRESRLCSWPSVSRVNCTNGLARQPRRGGQISSPLNRIYSKNSGKRLIMYQFATVCCFRLVRLTGYRLIVPFDRLVTRSPAYARVPFATCVTALSHIQESVHHWTRILRRTAIQSASSTTASQLLFTNLRHVNEAEVHDIFVEKDVCNYMWCRRNCCYFIALHLQTHSPCACNNQKLQVPVSCSESKRGASS
jgi:hypothetical protein